MDYGRFYSYLSPFIAAALACYVTHVLTIRSKKFDLLFQGRIPACKAILSYLSSIKRYCRARITDYQESEWEPDLADLAKEDRRSAAEHRVALRLLLDEHEVFLSAASRRVLATLYEQLGELCYAEILDDPVEAFHAEEPIDERHHKLALNQIETCMEALYRDLRLPR